MVKVLLADDSEVMRKAIKSFLEERPEILLVGEAETFAEAVQKIELLHPDVVVLDLHLPKSDAPINLKFALNGSNALAITFGVDDEARALADSLGVEVLLDKVNLTDELIPSILALHRTIRA
jgi:two-component system response regulator DevR